MKRSIGIEGINMTGKESRNVCATVENEGFDYAFCYYSNFEEIKDAKFHRLRKKYVEAARLLRDYIGLED